MKKVWGTEDDEKLKRMASEGASAKDIADVVGGCTRNAVLGRAWRLGISLSGGPKPAGRPKLISTGKAPAARTGKRKLTPRVAPTIAAFTAGERGVSFMDLTEGCCKWPTGDLFCGEPVEGNRPYCTTHAHIGRRQPLETQASRTSARRRGAPLWR